jgi:hypothetical protein
VSVLLSLDSCLYKQQRNALQCLHHPEAVAEQNIIMISGDVADTSSEVLGAEIGVNHVCKI